MLSHEAYNPVRQGTMKPQVIIVSNRLPISVKKEDGKLIFSSSIGGLATGLSSYVSGKRNLWVGWPGLPSDKLTEAEKITITETLGKQGYLPVFLSSKQIEDFYNGYSNSLLWPLFHGLSFDSNKGDSLDRWWRAYKSVNRLFAEAVLSNMKRNSQIWVHDYQLMLLPGLLRVEHPNNNIGFFLHIPFPAAAKLDKLSGSKEIVKGLLGANLIGFHTASYASNFIESVTSMALGQVENGQIVSGNRSIRVSNFPMGIDYNRFATSSKLKVVKRLTKTYAKKYRGLKVIASVDRLDPSKGLLERLKAYEQYLEETPKASNKVVFVMVAAPSRTDISDYQKLSDQIEKLVNSINIRFGSEKWQPVDYVNESLPFENVTALFAVANVAFITPLRDGMNLSAKEFVASNRKGGVLILSTTAGAAEELKDAIIVNPRDIESLVFALKQALTMRRRELMRRLKNMRKHLASHTVQDWAKDFIDALESPIPGTPHLTYTLNRRLKQKLIKQYLLSSKRLLLLDYDGSLVPFKGNYSEAEPPKALINLLKGLSEQPLNEIVLVSGRKLNDLDRWFGKLNINLVAEHGASYKLAKGTWKDANYKSNQWQKLLLPTLHKYAELTPGATVEAKAHSLVWHYRKTSPYYAQKYSVILKRALRPVVGKYGLEIVQGNKILEIKNPEINKGVAAKRWLNKPHDFILSIGDDTTDEDLFKILPIDAYSIKVGRGLSSAQYRLSSPKEVIALLKHLV